MVHQFKPYPQVWDAFADDEPALARLNSGLVFDVLTEVSKRFATQGKEAARAYLMSHYRPPVGQRVAAMFPERYGRRHPQQSAADPVKPPSASGIDTAMLFDSYAEWEAANLAKKARKETPP